MFQRPSVDEYRHDRGKHLGDPEGVPYAVWAHETGQDPGCGHDDYYIPEKGNHKGLRAFSETFHGTGGGDGHRRDDKTGADDLQGFGACGNGFRGGGEKSHKLS